MKKITILIITIFTFSLFGCKKNIEKTAVEENVIVAGEVLNSQNFPDNYSITIYERNLANRKGIKHIAFIDDNGNFKFEFKKYYTSDIFLQYGKMISLLVGPGDSIFIELDANEFQDKEVQSLWDCNTVKFSGDRKHTNEQIRLFHSIIISNEQNNQLIESEVKLSPIDYLEYLRERKLKWEKVLDTLNRSHELTDEFVDWSNLYTIYNFGYYLLHYTWYYPSVNRQDSEPIEIPISFQEALKDLSLDNEEIQICTQYNRYLNEYFTTYTFLTSTLYDKLEESNWKFAKSEFFETEFRKLLKTIEKDYQGIAEEALISRQFIGLLDYYGRLDVFENLYPEYKINIRNSLKSTLDDKYAELKEKSSINDTNIRKNGKEFVNTNANVFDELVNKNKGKVIYIDFWATWCVPCLKEFPNSKKLHNELKGKNVEFVYLCVNSKEEDWKQKIADYDLDGSHYFLSETQYDILSQQFQISGIPNYFLIDKNGVLYKNGPNLRPGKVKDDIVKLMNK